MGAVITERAAYPGGNYHPICACRQPFGIRVPTGPRQGEGHIAVRFGDHKQAGWKVIIGDDPSVVVDVTNQCTEAVGGGDGLVILVSLPGDSPAKCIDCGEYRNWLYEGAVTVSRQGPEVEG